MPSVKKTAKNQIGAGKPGPGRPKGVPNKITSELREMVLGALDDAGGRGYLAAQAKKNPSAFLTLLGKCLPKEITGPGGGPVSIAIRRTIVHSDRGDEPEAGDE